MIGTQHLPLFVVSGILLNLTPGQDTLYIVGRSVAQGRRAGFLSVLGIVSGSILHTLAAALGLSAVLATSGRAFVVVKLVGAGYLAYLGAKMLFARSTDVAPAAAFGQDRPWAIYRAGLFTNLLNPKVALFFMAFLPQFVAPTTDSRTASFLFLGGLFIFTGTLWCLVLAWAASAMSRHIRERGAARLALTRITGAVFVGLGVRLAVGE